MIKKLRVNFLLLAETKVKIEELKKILADKERRFVPAGEILRDAVDLLYKEKCNDRN